MLRNELRTGVAHVGLALRDPEAFAALWNDGQRTYAWPVWAALLATAIAGTTTYGMTMGLLGGASDIFYKGFICTLSAGLAWAIPLPALYILNSLSGSRLRASSTLLAALVTVGWGGLAMIASIPMNWFFTATIPHRGFVLLVNLIVFAGVGVSMSTSSAASCLIWSRSAISRPSGGSCSSARSARSCFTSSACSSSPERVTHNETPGPSWPPLNYI
jgi:hypothetical protein